MVFKYQLDTKNQLGIFRRVTKKNVICLVRPKVARRFIQNRWRGLGNRRAFRAAASAVFRNCRHVASIWDERMPKTYIRKTSWQCVEMRLFEISTVTDGYRLAIATL